MVAPSAARAVRVTTRPDGTGDGSLATSIATGSVSIIENRARDVTVARAINDGRACEYTICVAGRATNAASDAIP